MFLDSLRRCIEIVFHYWSILQYSTFAIAFVVGGVVTIAFKGAVLPGIALLAGGVFCGVIAAGVFRDRP